MYNRTIHSGQRATQATVQPAATCQHAALISPLNFILYLPKLK